uniref:Uncharacterized protein n=1 Tax=Geospiza parvula TaxID=87175 RepID=A0A8C3ND47_GEOPR
MGALLALGCLVLLLLAREGTGEGSKVRLCGRDFIRAVVFTCGGSRWRRDRDLRGEYGHGTRPALPCLLSPRSEQDLQKQASKAEQDSKVPVLNKREAAKLLATSCCNEGCSRTEISSLC